MKVKVDGFTGFILLLAYVGFWAGSLAVATSIVKCVWYY